MDKLPPLKGPDQVVLRRTEVNPVGFCPVPVEVEAEEVGAFGGAGEGHPFPQLPVEQVVGVKEGVIVVNEIERHDPAAGLRHPLDLRVAVHRFDLRDDRPVFPESPAAVQRIGGALGGGGPLPARRRDGGAGFILREVGPEPHPGGGVEEDDGRGAAVPEAGDVLPVDDGAAGEDQPVGVVGAEGRLPLGPVEQVAADGVPPVGVAVAEAEGVELEEHVVFTPVEIEAVGVVHKPAGGGEVVKGPEGFPVEVLLPETAGAKGDLLPERLRPVPREGKAVTVRLPVRQGDGRPHIRPGGNLELFLPHLFLLIKNGDKTGRGAGPHGDIQKNSHGDLLWREKEKSLPLSAEGFPTNGVDKWT